MHYHWGSSQTIQTKGGPIACQPPRHQHRLRGDIAHLRAEIRQLKAQSRKAVNCEEK